MRIVHKKDILLAITSGMLFIPGFPPYDFYPAAWVALLPLLLALGDKGNRASFALGMIAGFFYFCGTMFWIFNSMYNYGGVPAGLSVLFVIMLSCYLAVYAGLFSLFFSHLSKNSGIPAAFSVPVIWVTFEYLRTYVFTGFPWAMLGYTQYSVLPLIQISDITGVYGVSFLVAAVNGALFDLAGRHGGRSRALKWPLCLALLVVLLSVLYGTWRLDEQGGGGMVKVGIVQGNIEQDKKWDPAFQREVIDRYKRLTSEVMEASPELVVWPETAVPFIFGYHGVQTGEIIDFQKSLGSYLLFGSVLRKDAGSSSPRLSNSALLLSPEGRVEAAYDKIHLVPYGEYVPFRDLFSFIDKLVVAVGDFIPGEEPVVMEAPFAKIGTLICYEIIFPGLVRKFTDKGVNMLVTITNDAWFGRTPAPYQHFSMAVLRAVENRVPVVRAANTGISGFIDSRGRIIRTSGIFVEDVLAENVRPGNKKSIYTRYGDVFSFLCIAVFLSMLLLSRYGRR